MPHCKCRTINLAQVSLDSLKKMKKPVTPQARRVPPTFCPRQESVPAPPGPVSQMKIMVCTVKPVQFQPPPVPCVCPPCPPCRSYTERTMALLKAGLKMFVLYTAYRWTSDHGIWGGQKESSEFMLGILRETTAAGENATLPDMQMLRYKMQEGWNTLAGNLFYYTFGLPLKTFYRIRDSIMLPEEVLGGDEYCTHVTRDDK